MSEPEHSPRWEITIPIVDMPFRIDKYLFSLFSSLLLSGFLYLVYVFTQADVALKNLLKFQISTLPWGLVTSLFVHNHDSHIQENIVGLLIILPFFYYRHGIRNGFGLLVIFGVGGHLLSLLFFAIFNVGFYVYLSFIKQVDLSTISFGLFSLLPPSGAGISGALVGVSVYLTFDTFRFIKMQVKVQKGGKEAPIEDTYIRMIFMTIVGIWLLYFYIERTLADFKAFIPIVHNWIRYRAPDLLTAIITALNDVGNALPTTGNPFLSHVFGGVCGFLGFLAVHSRNRFVHKLRKIRKKENDGYN